MLELVPLHHKVVAAVITDLIDQLAMSEAHLGNFPGIDDDLATIGDGGFHLVHTLASRPKVIVEVRQHGEHALEGLLDPNDVLARREFRCCEPGLFRRSEKEAGGAFLGNDECEAPFGTRNELSRTIDHRPHRGVAGTDHVEVGDDSAKPMGEIDDLGARDAGEEVFIAARETDDLVREHGAADEDVVVVKNHTVQGNRDMAIQEAGGDSRDVGRGNLAEIHEGLPLIPTMIEDVGRAAAAVNDRLADQPRELSVSHGLVSAESDQVIERNGLRTEHRFQKAEHQRHGHGAGAVWNQDQYALAAEWRSLDRFLDDSPNGVFFEVLFHESVADDHVCYLVRDGADSERISNSGSVTASKRRRIFARRTCEFENDNLNATECAKPTVNGNYRASNK